MNKPKPTVPIKIELTDIITPKSCSNFIAELIKFIAYNKQQIPYPYERLKMFVMKRRERQKNIELPNSDNNCDTSFRVALLMEKYYKKVEEAYEILDCTFKCIEHELMQSSTGLVEEVVLLFGATPISPKDVYRIKIPMLCFGHSESQHLWRRQIANLFREVNTDEVYENLQKRVGLTNMFVMLKVKEGGCSNSKWLLPKDHYRLPDRTQQICFSFKSSNSKPCTCSERMDLEKLAQNMTSLNIDEDSSVLCDGLTPSDQAVWFQTSKCLKGFNDCKLQGKSVTDLWFKHRFIS